MSIDVDPYRVTINVISNDDNIKGLDFTEDDKSDPLLVQDFIKNKSEIYQKNNLTSLWAVKYDNVLVGFFALSMNSLKKDSMEEDDKVPKATTKRYPAMYLGQMGIDKKFRGRKLGHWICQYCVGLARQIQPRIACKVILLQTDDVRSKFYEKEGFKKTREKTQDAKIWMYKRVS